MATAEPVQSSRASTAMAAASNAIQQTVSNIPPMPNIGSVVTPDEIKKKLILQEWEDMVW